MFAIMIDGQFVTPPGAPMFSRVPTLSKFPYTVMDVMPDVNFVEAVRRHVIGADSATVHIAEVSFPRGYETEVIEEFRFGRGKYEITNRRFK